MAAVGERSSALGKGASLFLARANSTSAYYDGVTNDSDGIKDYNGTSFSAPQVTGALALAQERRAQLYPAAGPWLASTWRALAIGTADDVFAPGPDYKLGWGILNAVALVSLIEQDAVLGRGSLIKETTVATGAPKQFVVELPANTSARLSCAWNDPAGSPTGTFGTTVDAPGKMLKNDLDLRVEDLATGAKHYPWVLDPDLAGESVARRSASAVNTVIGGVTPNDDRNNVERIDIPASPGARRFKVTLSANGALQGGSQKASLILSGVAPIAPVATAFRSTQNPSNVYELGLSFVSDPGAFYTLQTSSSMAAGSWSDASSMQATSDSTTVLINRTPGVGRQFWRIRRGQ